jgi:hypothetical protein
MRANCNELGIHRVVELPGQHLLVLCHYTLLGSLTLDHPDCIIAGAGRNRIRVEQRGRARIRCQRIRRADISELHLHRRTSLSEPQRTANLAACLVPQLPPRCEHDTRDGSQPQHHDTHPPQELLPHGASIVEGQPVADKSWRYVEDDGRLVAVMGFVLTEHHPDVRHAQSLKLAVPLPSVLAIGPAILEGNSV